MVRKRQRHESVSCEPAVDSTDDKTTSQISVWGRSRERQRLVSICLPESREPSRGMKDRRLGMPFDEFFPSWIRDGIYLINLHLSSYQTLNIEDEPEFSRSHPDTAPPFSFFRGPVISGQQSLNRVFPA